MHDIKKITIISDTHGIIDEKIVPYLKNTDMIIHAGDIMDKNIINRPEVKKSIKIANKLMKGQGRMLVRKSGTESKIRVMGESENKELLKKCVDLISRKIK